MSSVKSAVFNILKRPLMTEKATISMAKENVYVFEVHPLANKNEIKNAVEKIFEVQVESVRTQNIQKKTRRGQGGKKATAWKKAYVLLAEKNKINLIEGL